MTLAASRDHEERNLAKIEGTVGMDLREMAPFCKGCQEVTIVGMVQSIFFQLVREQTGRSIQTPPSF